LKNFLLLVIITECYRN